MRTLVTGGAGYIGSVLTEVLVERGHAVTVIDNLVKGHADAVDPKAELVVAELSNRPGLVELLTRRRIDSVVHLAAHSLVGESMTHPLEYFENNVGSTLSLLGAMKEVGVQRLVFSSTAAVYGEPARVPIHESDATRPSNPYGESKLAVERVLRWCSEAWGLRAISLRYFNAAGASRRCGERHDPETHLIPLLLQAAQGTRPSVTIVGEDYPTPDGTCVRDYVHVLDLADAHVLALEALSSGPARHTVYNAGGTPKGHSVREVIHAVERVTGKKLVLERGRRRPGDPASLIANAERLQTELGWKPRHQELNEIVESAWRWMLSREEHR